MALSACRFGALFGAVLLSGCATAPEPAAPAPAQTVPQADAEPAPVPVSDSTGLVGRDWRVQTLDGQPVLSDPAPTLRFSADAVSGKAPCNRYNAQAAISTNEIAFSAPLTTRVVCEPDVMDSERQFFTIIGGIVQWRIGEDGTLTLRSRTASLTARR
jgi:heat shock protein HslJ